MIGNIISAGASLIGGLLGRDSAKDAQAANERMAQQNIEMQKQFAKEGIRWKVEDAKAAGIHPVYALGAPTTSFSPISFSATADDSMSKAVASMGQDIGGAINKTRTGAERADAYSDAVKALTLEKGALENEVLRSQLARIKQVNAPPAPAVEPDNLKPFPVPEATKSEERPPLMLFGHRWMTAPGTSPMKAWEDQYGDEGLASWVLPPLMATQDAAYNVYRRYMPQKYQNAARRGWAYGKSKSRW